MRINTFQLYSGYTIGIKDTKISDKAMNKIKENAAKIINDARKLTEKKNNTILSCKLYFFIDK